MDKEVFIKALDDIDESMGSLGQCLNLLDPDGTWKGMPSEELFAKTMQHIKHEYQRLSGMILALRSLKDEG